MFYRAGKDFYTALKSGIFPLLPRNVFENIFFFQCQFSSKVNGNGTTGVASSSPCCLSPVASSPECAAEEPAAWSPHPAAGRFLLVVSLSSLEAISWPPSLKRKRQLFGVGICWMFFLTLTNSSRASSKDIIYHQMPDTIYRTSYNQLRTKTCLYNL